MTAEISGDTNLTRLTVLAEQAKASGEWWKEGALEQRHDLELPPRVLVILDNAGIRTVEQLKAAGPVGLLKLPGLGKLAFKQIIDLLKALDKQSNGGG
jgi:DNA-directed RNA polymerase alpha subunit